MFTAQQLIQATKNHRPSILDKAKSISIRWGKTNLAKDASGDTYVHIEAQAKGDTIARQIELHIYGSGPKAKIWVRCSCPYQMYHCEVLLDRHDNTDLKYAIDRLPKITNSAMITHICKHLCACLLRGATDKAGDLLKAKKKVPEKTTTKKTAKF